MSSEINSSQDRYDTPKWSCDFAKTLGVTNSPIPIPIRVRKNLNYIEGIGYFDDQGQRLIGLPGGFTRSDESLHIAERLAEMREYLLEKFGPGEIKIDEETVVELLAIGQRPRGEVKIELIPYDDPPKGKIVQFKNEPE